MIDDSWRVRDHLKAYHGTRIALGLADSGWFFRNNRTDYMETPMRERRFATVLIGQAEVKLTRWADGESAAATTWKLVDDRDEAARVVEAVLAAAAAAHEWAGAEPPSPVSEDLWDALHLAEHRLGGAQNPCDAEAREKDLREARAAVIRAARAQMPY